MSDFDQTIRSELERIVPVASRPDWDAIALAANLRGSSTIREGRRRRHIFAIALASLVIVGAGVAAVGGQLAWWQRGSHPEAVIEDAYRDGTLGREWNCPSLRAAIRKLPEDVVRYSNVGVPIFNASERRCAAALGTLQSGASRQQVTAALGPPDATRSECWLYRWKPLSVGKVRVNARVCFRSGFVIRIGRVP